MSAKTYNDIRRILFCTANDPMKGFPCAYEYLERTYKKKLDNKGYVGILAELKFYEKYRREFNLTVAGDMGEHADFAGTLGREATRFDVTTNINFKKFHDYEPYMGHGPSYKIALLDQGNFEVIDVLNLAFPKCECCGGYLIPTVILLDQNYNRHGDSLWNNDQLLIDICENCEEYFERERYTHSGLLSVGEYHDYNDDDMSLDLTESYITSIYKYFRRQHSDYLMAVGSHGYRITKPDGGGYWALNLNFINSAVSNRMPKEIECSHEI